MEISSEVFVLSTKIDGFKLMEVGLKMKKKRRNVVCLNVDLPTRVRPCVLLD